MDPSKLNRRTYGDHLTPINIFNEFILPEIKNILYDYIWIDLFAGYGNLILPILDLIPQTERVEYFQKHIFLFDIQKESIEQAIENAAIYGIPKQIAEQNIILRDTIKDYPKFLLNSGLPVYHITNPPYLYLGYIAKHQETRKYLEYFTGENEGYQDLYQLGLKNDLKHNLSKMIYIIPSNFLFGYTSSNKIKYDFFKYYSINKAVIFEKEIFEYTGTNVAICFFERKQEPKHEVFSFEGIKINNETHKRNYVLDPKNHYRPGNEFDLFVNDFRAKKPLEIKYYLEMEDVNKNEGDNEVDVIDANDYKGREYEKKKIYVNNKFHKKIKSNILFVRTVDKYKMGEKAGLYITKDIFGVDGVLVSKSTHRTHPIQIFIKPILSKKDQKLLKDYFNLMLEYFRETTDSEFLTTYKYSHNEYTRKYVGLLQIKKLIKTFPLLNLSDNERAIFIDLIEKRNTEELKNFVKNVNNNINLNIYDEQQNWIC